MSSMLTSCCKLVVALQIKARLRSQQVKFFFFRQMACTAPASGPLLVVVVAHVLELATKILREKVLFSIESLSRDRRFFFRRDFSGKILSSLG